MQLFRVSAHARNVLIDALMALLLDKGWRQQLYAAVKLMADREIPGEQKRQEVIEMLANAGLAIAASVLNLAIELAVTRSRS